MQFHVDAGDARPTFFELVAADKLVPSLRAALVYSIRVLVARRPSLSRLLDHEAEAFALFMLLVESHSFATSDGSMAEGLYGLQRTRAAPAASAAAPSPATATALAIASLAERGGGASGASVAAARAAANERRAGRITKTQKIASVACLVLVPYLRDKLDALYDRWRAAEEEDFDAGRRRRRRRDAPSPSDPSAYYAAALLGEDREDTLGDATPNASQHEHETETETETTRASSPETTRAYAPPPPSSRVRLRRAFVAVYPYAHAALEAASFYHALGYLLGGLDCHDPTLRALRVRTARVSPAELAERRVETERRRSLQLARIADPSRSKTLRRWVASSALRASHFAADYAQGGLMMAVVGFKLMEWWYGTAEERLAGSASLPVPPPPPPPPPRGARVEGVEPGACPLCRASPMREPAMVTRGGYAFCHACALAHVREKGACPVTLEPATEADVVKLFSE
jgi:peroxin-12